MELSPDMWLSTVRAVPTIGVVSKPTFESGSDFLGLLRGLLQRWDGHAKGLKISLEPLKLSIDESSGFLTSVEPGVVSTTFKYKAAIHETDRVHPVLEYVSEPRPVAAILDDCVKRTIDVFQDLQKTSKREIDIIGVMVSGNIPADNPPPGFVQFLDHVVSPWAGKSIPVGNLRFRVDLDECDGYSNRCNHVFEYNKESERPALVFHLDWQRKYSRARALSHSNLSVQIAECISDAFDYFNKFAIGDLSYAE